MAASDFSTAMKQPGTIVLDVRTPAEYASGHLAQAKNIDIEAFSFAKQIASLDKNATYAVYCHSGRRSAIAVQQLETLGFADTYDLAGGISAWAAAGGQVVTGP